MSGGIQRLKAVFETGQKALVPYLTAGDPTLDVTADLLRAVADGGADIIELGIPFSDPMADGPVLQLAAERALKNDVDLGAILEMAATFCRQSDVPVILFGYYNPFFRYGHEKLARDAADAGICGVLCVDLPPEEAGPLHQALRDQDLALVPLLTPTSDASRIARVRPIADAFGYYVSITGVTGAALTSRQSICRRVSEVRNAFGRPIVVGFGVRTPDDARELSENADGVVVGSALVKLAHETPQHERADAVRRFVCGLKAAI